MKSAATICMALLAIPICSQAAGGSFSQGGGVEQKAASLIGATATLSGGLLTVTGSTEELSTEWNHVFLGTDGNPDAGYVHPSGKKGGVGMQYLVEGAFVYRWSGLGDRQEWKWDKLDSIPVTRTKEGQTFTVSFPVGELKLKPGSKLRIFLATSNENYQTVLDTLPRGDDVWEIDVPADALNKTSDNAAPAVAEPAADARERFKKITSYACYYGKDKVAELSRRGAAIIETRSQSAENIAELKKKGRSSSAISARVRIPL